MLEASEKARIMLSSVTDAQINIDYLLNEEDLVRVLKKDEFEQLIAPYVQRFQDLIKRTISASGKSIHAKSLFFCRCECNGHSFC
jgi:molecular chaperone DnaK (HSP70)